MNLLIFQKPTLLFFHTHFSRLILKFWYELFDSWYLRPKDDPIDWRSLLAAFNNHSHYINSVISIEPTNKLLKEAYNSYQHMFRADNAYQGLSE